MLSRLLVLPLALLCSAQGHAAGPAAVDGKKLFQAQCVACHGTHGAGNAALQAPPLAGLDAGYVSRQLNRFKQGLRGANAADGPAATMRAVALTLQHEQDITALASHVATLRPAPTKPQPPAALAAAGKAYFAICVGCHGGTGEGNASLSAPALKQLPPWYIEAQLKAFRAGNRGGDPTDILGRQMRSVAIETFPDDEALAAVAAYVGSLAGGSAP